MSDPASPQTVRRLLPQNLPEIAFFTVVLMLIAGFSAILFNVNKTLEIDQLRAQLADQQGRKDTADAQPAAPQPPAPQASLHTELNKLINAQQQLRGDVQTLNSALAGVIVERDQLRADLAEVRAVQTHPSAPAPTPAHYELRNVNLRQTPSASPSMAAARHPQADAVNINNTTTPHPPVEQTPVSATATPQPLTVSAATTVLREVPGQGLKLQEIHFSPSSSKLSPGALRRTQKAAQLFKTQHKSRIRLLGFSDSVGKRSANQRIAARRAAEVAAVLIEAGISRDRIEIVAQGENGMPMATADGVDEPLNRCVGIFATD